MTRILTRGSLRFALALLVAGNAGAGEPTCAERHLITERLNVSGGVYTERAVAAAPLSVEIPIGVERAGYADCLQREHVEPHAPVGAYFDRLASCRQQRRGERTLRIAPASSIVHLDASDDKRALQACLEGAIEVEATLPE